MVMPDGSLGLYLHGSCGSPTRKTHRGSLPSVSGTVSVTARQGEGVRFPQSL